MSMSISIFVSIPYLTFSHLKDELSLPFLHYGEREAFRNMVHAL